jgi:uncharacterized protein YndB with AHSA1/START domain
MKAVPRVLLIFLLAAGPAMPAVVDTSPTSLTVESSVDLEVNAEVAFERFTRDLPVWWDPAHTWSGDAANLSLEPRAGGCFCEMLPSTRGSVQHGRVIFWQPGKLLRLDAALGPFQEMAVQGVLTFRFTPQDTGKGSRVTVNYRVSGAISMDPVKLAPMVDGMLAGQMRRFQNFTATGKPAG